MKFHTVLRQKKSVLTSMLVCMLMLSFIASCSGSNQIASPTVEGVTSKKPQKKKNTSTSLDDGDTEEVHKDANGLPIDGSAAIDTTEFPKFKFSGSGQTSNDGKGYETTSVVVTELMSDSFVLDQLDANVITPSKQEEATADIRANAVGKTVYKRATIEQRKSIVDANGKAANVNYVIFASGVTDVKGKQFAFSTPLPAFPYPGEKARYKDLLAGSVTWKSTVTGGGSVFDVRMTVSAVDVSANVVRINFITDIPSDTDGRLYEIFPPARTAEYTITTNDRRVSGMRQTYWFYADGNQYSSKKKETTEMGYNLCSVTKKGAVETVSSCP